MQTNATAVSCHDFARNRQPQTPSVTVASRQTKEAFEYLALKFLGNTGTVIRHGETYETLPRFRRHDDGISKFRVLGRIGDQVGENMMNLARIDIDERKS